MSDDNIVEMFASLITSSSERQNKQRVHPAFISVIQQLSSIDAIGLMWLWKKYTAQTTIISSIYFPIVSFSRIKNKRERSIYLRDLSEMIFFDGTVGAPIDAKQNSLILDNAERLGLIQRSYDSYISNKNNVIRLERHKGGMQKAEPRGPYDSLLYDPRIVDHANTIRSEGDEAEARLGYGRFTDFGNNFFRVVIR